MTQYDPNCVSVLVDEARQARYLQEGMRLNGKCYDFTYRVPTEAAPNQKADLIFITTKSNGLEAGTKY